MYKRNEINNIHAVIKPHGQIEFTNLNPSRFPNRNDFFPNYNMLNHVACLLLLFSKTSPVDSRLRRLFSTLLGLCLISTDRTNRQ